MGRTLRQRILIALLPLLVLVAVLGGAGVWLLHRLGGSINVILRENYDSVVAMWELKEALEGIDASFRFSLIADKLGDAAQRQNVEDKARRDFEQGWQSCRVALNKERANITILPTEEILFAKLVNFTEQYEERGRAFLARRRADKEQAYHGMRGLEEASREIKQVADDILQLNQAEMIGASAQAKSSARASALWLSFGLAAAIVLALLFAWQTLRTIVRPIDALTEAAQGISAGNLDALVPYQAGHELGQLAQAFNTMAHHLRDFRQSQTAQLLRAQKTSQATIDSFPDAVIVVDAAGMVELANPAARRLLGVVPSQHGQAAPSVWQPPEGLRQALADALEGQKDYLPEGFDHAILLGSSGRERALLPRIMPIRDAAGLSLGAAVLLQDVTRLRLLDQVKSNLVATASHELKTPLTGVRLAVYLLLEEKIGPLTPKQIELLLDARDNSERLLAVVNNLLDLTRLEQGSLQLDAAPEAPGALLQAAADKLRPRALDKGVEIVLDMPAGLPAVAVDAARFGNALDNLLDNALTYSERGGRITLAVRATPSGVTMTVADTGCGITPGHMPHLFEKFFRAPGQERGSGTGLGLAIVREIVVAHGGTISCASEPGAGTTFTITLPIIKQPQTKTSEV